MPSIRKKTQKKTHKPSQRVQNRCFRNDTNGFIFLHLEGTPYEIGFAHGHLCKPELAEIHKTIDFVLTTDFGKSMSFFVDLCATHITPDIRANYPDIYEELCGIAEGSGQSLDWTIFWSNYITVTEYLYPNIEQPAPGAKAQHHGEGGAGSDLQIRGMNSQPTERCSAFIATGDYTADGKVCCAHINFSNFVDGQYAKVVIDMVPNRGNRMLWLGFIGIIFSATDFAVTSSGLLITETTFGNFMPYENLTPISVRMRQAMQYSATLDDFTSTLLDGNGGDYANSYLLADLNTNEIMRFELGLKYHAIDRTKNGYYIGFNAPYSAEIRALECSNNAGFFDIRRHQGARRVRLTDLMEHHKGAIDTEIAKQIISDHYDVYTGRENPCSRTVCAHYELDAREFMSQADRPMPYQPRGSIDGNICTTDMGLDMAFLLRYGNSCGLDFDKNAFCDKHRQWDHLRPYLHSRLSQPWTVFSSHKRGKKPQLTRKNRRQKST